MSEKKGEEQLINPDAWTEKELLKHLYREFRTMGESLSEIKLLNSELEQDIEGIERDVNIMKNTAEVKEFELNKRMARNNAIATILGTIIAALALWAAFWEGT
jgi:Mg2+ and Co2+ transporter CorA|tara:strand:+ start:4923 stop:5231 length:309 start_codon:yes stop_codon:yes gene_type:complete